MAAKKFPVKKTTGDHVLAVARGTLWDTFRRLGCVRGPRLCLHVAAVSSAKEVA